MTMLAAVTGLLIWIAVLTLLTGAAVRAERHRLLQAESAGFESFSRAEIGAFAGKGLGQGVFGADSGLDWGQYSGHQSTEWFGVDGGRCVFGEDHACWQAELGPVTEEAARGGNVAHRERLLLLRVVSDCAADAGYAQPGRTDTAARLASACDVVELSRQAYRRYSFLQYGLHVGEQALPPGQRRFLSGGVTPVTLLDASWGAALHGIPTHFNAERLAVCVPDGDPPGWLDAHDAHDGSADLLLGGLESGPNRAAVVPLRDDCGADDNDKDGDLSTDDWGYKSIPGPELLVAERAAAAGCPTDPTLRRDGSVGAWLGPPPGGTGHIDDVYGPAYPRHLDAAHGSPHGFADGSEYMAWPRLPPYPVQEWMQPAFAAAGGHPNRWSPPAPDHPAAGYPLPDTARRMWPSLTGVFTADLDGDGTAAPAEVTGPDGIFAADLDGDGTTDPLDPADATGLTVDLGDLKDGQVVASRWDLRVIGRFDPGPGVPVGAATVVSAGSIVVDFASGPAPADGGVDPSGNATVGAADGDGHSVALIAGCDIIIETAMDNVTAGGSSGLPHMMTPRPHWYPCLPGPDLPGPGFGSTVRGEAVARSAGCVYDDAQRVGGAVSLEQGLHPDSDGDGADNDTPTLPQPSICSALLSRTHVTTLHRVAMLAPSGGVYPRLAECPRAAGAVPEIRIVGAVASGYLGAFSFQSPNGSFVAGYDIVFEHPPGFDAVAPPWWPDPLGGLWQPIG